MAFTRKQKEAIGYLILDGEWQQFSPEKQLAVFKAGYKDDINGLYHISKTLVKAKNQGLINFDPSLLAEYANQRAQEKSQAKAAARSAQQQSVNPIANQPIVTDTRTGQQMTPNYIARSIAPYAAKDMGSSLAFDVSKFVAQPNPQAQPNPETAFNANPVNRSMTMRAEKTTTTTPAPIRRNIPMINFPQGYNTLPADKKCEFIVNTINASQNTPNPIQGVRDSLAGYDMQQRVAILERNYQFIKGAHPGMHSLQLACLANLLSNATLKRQLSKFKVQDINNIQLLEVPLMEYTVNANGKWDFAFMTRSTDRRNGILILFDSVPKYNTNTGTWYNDFSVDLVTFGKKIRNPYTNTRPTEAGQAAMDLVGIPNLLEVPIGQIVTQSNGIQQQ